MNSSDNKKWYNILMVALCVIIVLGLGSLFWSPAHSVVNMYFVPAGLLSGFSFGTCSNDDIQMTYTGMATPTYADSFLYQFGESEPARGPDMPPLTDYPMRREVVDPLMAWAQVNGTEKSIIGLYEFPDSQLLLINNDTTLTEVLETGDGIRIFPLIPRRVGSRHTGASETGYHHHPTYNSSTDDDVTVHRIDLVLPGPGNATAPLYIVKKTRTDTVLYPDGAEVFMVSTTGTFYVLYGQRVDRVLYGAVISHDPGWKICSQKIGMSMNGMTGELRHTVKFARSSERILHAHLIITSPLIQVHEASGGSTSQWKSRDSTGCSC
ncbi:MAG: hypothetical protein STSR0009_24640 [Methanoregula sp.]